MVTIKDIAKAAGVAQGTVSNVLNGRGNVSSEKIRLVQEVCRQLGYVPNERAKLLRQGHARLLGTLLPDLNTKAYIDFYLGFKAYAESHGYGVRQYIPRTGSQDAEAAFLHEAQSDMVSGVALFASAQHLSAKPISSEMPMLYVEQRPDFEADYIGFDYAQAGRDLGRSVLSAGHKRVILLVRSLKLASDREFCAGFMKALDGADCQVFHLQAGSLGRHQNLLQIPDLPSTQAVVCAQLELAHAARDILSTFYTDSLPEFYTLSPLLTMPETDYRKYELNYRLLGNNAARRLIRRIEKRETPGMHLLKNTGFRAWVPAAPSKETQPDVLKIATLDSPTAEIMRSMARLYTRHTGIPVNISVFSYDEIHELYSNLRKSSGFDILRLDVTWMSWFADRILRPLEEIDPSVTQDLSGFLSGVSPRCSHVGDTLYGLPHTPSTHVLFYRRDLFESAINRRMFQEKYKRELTVPRTFEEFNRIAEFFTRSLNPDSPVRYGATMTLGSTGVAGSEYLARLFAMQDHLYDEDGYVRLNSAAGVRAMEQLLEIKRCSSKHFCSWWTHTAETFASGDVAMAILYNNFASPIVGHNSRVHDNIGYAMIPGGRPLIGGGALCVSRYSRHPQEALRFIRWACSEPIASASTLLGSVSPCKATYDNYDIINNYPWLRLASGSFTAARGNRIPPGRNIPFDERRFVSIIGVAVKNAYSGALTPQQAMDDAQHLFEEHFPECVRK